MLKASNASINFTRLSGQISEKPLDCKYNIVGDNFIVCAI